MQLNEIDSIIREFYPEGGSEICSQKTGKNRDYILQRAHRIGVKVNPGVKMRLSNAKPKRLYIRDYKVDIDKFLLMGPEACYSLGFLWGDGWIQTQGYHYTIALSIVSEDFLDIEKIFYYLGDWNKQVRKREGRREQTSIKTTNKRIHNFLLYNDYKDKSLCSPQKILNLIPNDFKCLWWRGYSDADGCFSRSGKHYNRFSFTGNYDTDWSSVNELLNSMDIKHTIDRRISTTKDGKLHKNSCLRLTSQFGLLKWINYIYPNKECGYDGFGLKRKFNKAMEMFNHYNRPGI